MRIAVIGAGAVGGYFGPFLARGGHDVRFIARGAHGEAIRSNGLTVRGPLGEFTVHAPVSESTGGAGPAELVLHAVKSYGTASSLPLRLPLWADGADRADTVAADHGPDE